MKIIKFSWDSRSWKTDCPFHKKANGVNIKVMSPLCQQCRHHKMHNLKYASLYCDADELRPEDV